jgi:hypothetical protein
MDQNRGNWYLLTGLILGLTLGLIYAWVISPVSQVDTHPSSLRADYKDIYRSLISRAFLANNNLPRAKARLELLKDDDPAMALAAQAQRFLAEGGDNETALILANLSAGLQSTTARENTPQPPSAAENITETSSAAEEGSPQESQQRTAIPSQLPDSTPSPSPTESPPFILQDSWPICDPTLGESLIQITATNAAGEGIPGVEILISLGTDPKETFYTGLKPDLGLGYADYSAEPGLTYQLEIPESGLIISDIEVPTCQTESDQSYWGSWEIYITHPN